MSVNFKHILVPVDFSDKNSEALQVATTFARQNGAQVTLLHVVETIDYADDEEIVNFYERLSEKSEKQLQELVEPFSAAGVVTSHETIRGHRVEEIVGYAVQNDVDLVILSSHKVDPSDPNRGWSTLSYQVAIVCPCPVLLVK